MSDDAKKIPLIAACNEPPTWDGSVLRFVTNGKAKQRVLLVPCYDQEVARRTISLLSHQVTIAKARRKRVQIIDGFVVTDWED